MVVNFILSRLLRMSKKRKSISKVAEEIGFEPTVGYPTLTFQASTLNHSDTLPNMNYTKQSLAEGSDFLFISDFHPKYNI